MISSADPHTLLALSLRIACVGVVLRSLALLLNFRHLVDNGLLGWNPEARARKALAWRFRALLCHPGCVLLLIAQLAAGGVGLVLGFEARTAFSVSGALLLLQAWYNYRFAIVYQGADTMFLIGFGAVFAASFDYGSTFLAQAALAFLGIQVLLAYLLSGRAKVTSRAWRDGSHLIEILLASSNRMEVCGRWLSRHPGLARVLARSVIALELLFPLALLAPSPLFVVVLACGLLFHGSIAIVMGLPGFFWSFGAAYPALWFLHQRLQSAL